MNVRFLGLLGIFAATALTGCDRPPVEYEEEFEEEPTEVDDETSQPAPEPTPSNPPKKSSDDEGFDSCPSDTYVLLEDGGITYTIVIKVFCEPVMDMNLGCPGP